MKRKVMAVLIVLIISTAVFYAGYRYGLKIPINQSLKNNKAYDIPKTYLIPKR